MTDPKPTHSDERRREAEEWAATILDESDDLFEQDRRLVGGLLLAFAEAQHKGTANK